MANEKRGTADEAAERTGELVGKGLKKGWGIGKALGKKAKETIEKADDKKA